MPFDDLSLHLRILLGIIVPPALTVFCWVIGRRIARREREPVPQWNSSGFWALLMAAYLFMVLAVHSARSFAGADRRDPFNQLAR
jgi:hypothetical protein